MKVTQPGFGLRNGTRATLTVACAAMLSMAAPQLAAQGTAAPVTINIVDVAGNLALTQDAIDAYQKKNTNKVAKINYTKAPAPELPGKLKAMQGAGRSDIDLVLTGTDFLAAGIEQGVLMKILPDQAAKFPNLMANYQPAAAKMQELAQDYGIEVVFMPAGPLLEYNPDKVKQAIFSSLGQRVAGARVLDLYAGTGALGLEALSRGANDAVLVDNSRFSVEAALLVLQREAEYRASQPTPPGLFVYQFETLCRNRLGYDEGLRSMAGDPFERIAVRNPARCNFASMSDTSGKASSVR